MAKTDQEDSTEVPTEAIYNGSQASELFGIHPAYKLWVQKLNLFSVEKTKSDWENFFKENKII